MVGDAAAADMTGGGGRSTMVPGDGIKPASELLELPDKFPDGGAETNVGIFSVVACGGGGSFDFDFLLTLDVSITTGGGGSGGRGGTAGGCSLFSSSRSGVLTFVIVLFASVGGT